MKLRMIDALDSFSYGGYIDLHTAKYIAPKWFSRLCPENDTGLSDIEYEYIQHHPERYLQTPVFRNLGIDWVAAEQMGISREQLIRLGVPCKEFDAPVQILKGNRKNPSRIRSNVSERKICRNIEYYMNSQERAREYAITINQILQQIVKGWFEQRGIEIVPDDQPI